MAFFLNNTSISSHFRSHSQKTQDAFSLSRRGFHIEPGPREKALLADDPVLQRFKSHKKNASTLSRVADVLIIAFMAGCCYKSYVRTAKWEEAQKQESESA